MRKIIDIHTHVFNLNYIPVRGVLQAHGVPKRIARLLEIVLLKLTNSSFFTDSTQLKQKLTLEDALPSFSQELLVMKEEDVIKDIIERAIQHPDVLSNIKILIELEEVDFDGFDASVIHEKTWVSSLLGTSEGLKSYKKNLIVSKLAYLINKFMSGFHYLKWFRFMMRSEKYIYNNLIQNYKDVEFFVFHMMDSDKFFNGSNKNSARARFSIDYKIEKMQKLIGHSKKKLIGFVPFNPKRKEGLKLIIKALEFEGFKGVKFYPPLGYRATCNDDDEMEKRIDIFFKYCETHNISVFTHCTDTGFESVPKVSGKNSDPYYWEKLLIKYPNLILCLGHAGGVEGWFAPFTENKIFPRTIDINGNTVLTYAEKVYKLCTTYKNVYCDVGFLNHIYKNHKKENFKERLKYLLELETPNKQFQDSIMYGSDFHILFNEGIQYNYHEQYLEILKEIAPQAVIDKFFYRNAQTYLNL